MRVCGHCGRAISGGEPHTCSTRLTLPGGFTVRTCCYTGALGPHAPLCRYNARLHAWGWEEAQVAPAEAQDRTGSRERALAAGAGD